MSLGKSFGSALGGSLGGAVGGMFGNLLGVNNSKTTASGSSSGTRTTQKVLSQEGIDKLIYDVMSSDQGLAALATAENASGGYGSSSKGLLAQDLVAKVVGEIANITAPTTETFSESATQTSKTKKGSVICTECFEKGFIAPGIFHQGKLVFKELNPTVVRGYHFWAIPFVEKVMKKDVTLSWHHRLLPWIAGRYDFYLYGRNDWRGALTVYIGHPVCWIIGSVLNVLDMLGAQKWQNKVTG